MDSCRAYSSLMPVSMAETSAARLVPRVLVVLNLVFGDGQGSTCGGWGCEIRREGKFVGVEQAKKKMCASYENKIKGKTFILLSVHSRVVASVHPANDDGNLESTKATHAPCVDVFTTEYPDVLGAHLTVLVSKALRDDRYSFVD